MKYTIIITGDFKELFLSDTINSLNQTKASSEIIIVYNHLYNENILKKKFEKKIKFIKTNKKKKIAVQDQLNKIKIALKYSSGKIILLCDGDDKFYRNKVEIISGYVKNENDIFFHDFKISKNNKTYLIKNKSYKLNYLFKKFFNSWPEKISTSAIVISKKNLNNFFKTHQISEFKFLAIDALLGVFFLNKIKFIKKILMIKNEDDKNRVDLYYVNNLKNYINRRIEQHEYYSSIYNENKKIEYIILRFINYFLIF